MSREPEDTTAELPPVTPAKAAKREPAAKKKPKRRRRSAVPRRADIFDTFNAQLAAVDWTDTIKREAAVSAIMGQLIVAVATAGKLRKEERERLQWVMSLAKEMKGFRDTAQIDAALRKLAGNDGTGSTTVEGPTCEPDPEAVTSGEHEGESGGERGEVQALRGRPRARALA